jgi:hypothetical protein
MKINQSITEQITGRMSKAGDGKYRINNGMAFFKHESSHSITEIQFFKPINVASATE